MKTKNFLLIFNLANKLKYITGLLLVFISVNAFSQSTYHIDPGATSNGDGTMGSPYDGWDKVFPMEAGAVYLQKTGTTWMDSLGIEADGVTIGSYGTATEPAKIIATGKDAISNIDGTAQNVTIKDLWITSEGSGKGIYWLNSSGLTVENVEVDSTDGFGIHIDGVDNFVVRNSHIHHNDRPFMVYNSDNWLVEYCDIHDGVGRGGFQTNNTNGGMFRFNRVHDDPNNKYLLFTEGNDTYAYNIIYNSGKAAAQVTNGNSSFIGNIFDNTSYGLRIKSGTSTIVKNNIFSNLANRGYWIDGAKPTESDYNIFYNVRGAYLDGSNYTLEEWQAVDGQTLDLNSINGDPNYMDVDNYNFEPTDSSASIDAGIALADELKMGLKVGSSWPNDVETVNQIYNGETWDIGAYVFPNPIYYVDPSLAINGDGTKANPYNSWANVDWAAGGTYLQKRGTVSNDTIGIMHDNVTIGSYGPEYEVAKIIVNGKDAISNIADTAKNVTIRDLWITTEGSGRGIYWLNSSGLTVENVEIDSTDGFGIHIDGVDHFVVRNSHIHHNNRPVMVYNSDNWLVEYCDIHDGVNRGAFQTNNTNGGIFRYNRVHDDPNNKYLLFTEGNDTYAYNIIFNSGKAAAQVTNGNSTFIGNTFNNTNFGLRIKSGTNTVVKNNIFSNMNNRAIWNDGALPSESDYNMFYNVSAAYLDGTNYSIEEWKAIDGQTLDLNSFNGDPNYVDVENYNFELTDSSAAIDAGAELGEMYKMALDTSSVWPAMVRIINQDDQGNSWEIGAYAYPTFDKFGTLTITSENGTVTPAERTYLIGTVVELTAKGDLGYAFESWSGDVTSTDNPLSVKVDSNMNLTVNYIAVDTYSVTASTQNASVNFADSTVNTGTEIELSVVPDSAYAFVNWTDANGDTISSEASFTLTVDKDYQLTANTVRLYTLTAVFPKGGSVVPMEGIYNEGTEVEVEASASFGYTFTGWSGDASGMDEVITVTMDSDKEVIASFKEAYMLTLNSDSQKGTVDQESGWYIQDTTITITATAKEGYQFLNWMGGSINSTDNPLELTLSGNMTITANYIKVYNLDITAENGSVNYSDTVIRAEERIELIATPDEGYVFTGWSGDVSGDQESMMVTVDKDMNITANFAKLNTLTVTAENGSVNVTDTSAIEGTEIQLIATPDEGYQFDGWTGDVTGDNDTIMITLDSDMSITANFTEAVGINSFGMNAEVSVYPNPATNFLNIMIEGNTMSYKAEILNSAGVRIMIENISSNDELNVSTLKTGVYILRILDENQLIHHSSIIIN